MTNEQIPQELKDKAAEKVSCPDCEKAMRFLHGHETERYGILRWFKCGSCKETFVTKNGGEPEIAAP